MVIFVSVILMFYFPYAKHQYPKGQITIYESLYHLIGGNWKFNILTIPFWWPILLIFELSILKTIEKTHIWIFVLQCLILSVFTYFAIELLGLCFMCKERVLLFNYYIIMLNLFLGIILNFILIGLIGNRESRLIDIIVKYCSVFLRE